MRLVLLVFAFVCFAIGAFVQPPKVNLISVGLAFLAASMIFPLGK